MIKHLFVNISANFRQNGRLEYSWARGTLLQEKKLDVENLVLDSLQGDLELILPAYVACGPVPQL
jgi:hypothetical protein